MLYRMVCVALVLGVVGYSSASCLRAEAGEVVPPTMAPAEPPAGGDAAAPPDTPIPTNDAAQPPADQPQ